MTEVDKSEVYKSLEASMLTIADYKDILVIDNGELLAPVEDTERLTAKQRGGDMTPYTGDVVYVRQGVLRRLSTAAELLVATDPNLSLNVTYGYRALQVQTKNFELAKQKFSGEYTDEELDMAAHRLTARPDVAGHPTGGAVDIQITRGGEPIDFGTKIGDFVPDTYTFSPFIGLEAMRNRMLLRTVMMSTGFAPFDGEWWHFSYGDKEWAKYYKQSNAIYNQLTFQPSMIANQGEKCENE
jgi:D-alanyl-D-alanine dipeptidase